MVAETPNQVKTRLKQRVSVDRWKRGAHARVALMYLLGKAKALGWVTML